ncbi:hypothetical protein IFR05_011824 [Cadophora sp. M221]|nr:hypothetical protein IFR05_011824 [Cadophora sp. M221]
MPDHHPDGHNDSFASPSTFDIVLTTPTPTERRQRNTLLSSLPLPDMPSVTDYFASDYMDTKDDIATPPIPIRRRPSLNLRPLSIPPHGPLPPLPNTPYSTQFSSTTLTPTSSTLKSPRPKHRRENAPPTPSSLAPEKMTNLLTEVLNIMSTVMDQQHSVKEEDNILADLTELVVIMQEEAEGLLHLASLVEEFVEEIEISKEAAEIEDWVEDLGLDELPEISDGSGETTETELDVVPVIIKQGNQGRDVGHGREDSFDSALGLDDESSKIGHVRDSSETIHQAAIVQIAQLRKSESDTRRGNLVEIGRRALKRSEGTVSMPQTPLIQVPRTTQTPRAQYIPHRKASLGSIKLRKVESKNGKLRKQPPPPLSPFRDSALIMSPTTTLGFKKGRIGRGDMMSPRWI